LGWRAHRLRNIVVHSRDAGEYLQGCQGDFNLLGGTGKFDGITGQSPFEIRSNIGIMVANLTSGRVAGSASGLAVWPALSYKIP
jgi:hypothetical protein